jgi:cytochrome oxidase assembly protein ShyY1
LRTSGATLLIVRGFLAETSSGAIPTPTAPPTGPVTVTAHVQAPESRHDAAAQLNNHQVESINPAEQAARIGGAVYNGYAELESHQPGTRGLTGMPGPDLSNPAGGALEPQHFAYVIQWYLFAILALAAPFAMARAESKHERDEQIDDETVTPDALAEPSAADLRAAKLADRYGRVR